MPLPKKDKNENWDEFKNRCMGNEVMNREFPDAKQRLAVCRKQFEKSQEKKKKKSK